MNIQLIDTRMCSHQIDTPDAQLAAQWLASWLPLAISADSRDPEWRMRIWPSTPEEFEVLKGTQNAVIELSQDGLLSLAQVFLDASQRLADKQCSNT